MKQLKCSCITYNHLPYCDILKVAGMLLYFVFTNGQHPFVHEEDEPIRTIEEHVFRGDYILRGLEKKPELCSLIQAMLNVQVQERPSITVVKKYV